MESSSLPFKGRACWQISRITNETKSFHSHDPNQSLSLEDCVKALFIMLITIAVILLNLLMILVLHSKNYSRYLRELPKILMTSLSLTDLAVGTLVTPISFISSLYRCWPWNQTVCAIEALLISALFHESTLSLLCIAIDRYICIVHPLRYHSLMTRKVCYTMVSLSWFISFSVYSILIYPNAEYHYDSDGLMSCEPFYTKKVIIIAATALFFIPPAIILVYCYVTILRVAHKQIRTIQNSPPNVYSTIQGFDSLRKVMKEKKKTYRSLITLGSISAGFLIAVAPWTLTEFISSVWEIDVPTNFGFTVTWIAISNSFWNPILYGLLNKSFRNVAIDVIRRICCRNCLINYIANMNTYYRSNGNNFDYNNRNSPQIVNLETHT